MRHSFTNWVKSNFYVPPPHGSGRRTQNRTFMPSATALLAFEKSVRDWAAGQLKPASDTHSLQPKETAHSGRRAGERKGCPIH